MIKVTVWNEHVQERTDDPNLEIFKEWHVDTEEKKAELAEKAPEELQ